MAKKTVYRGRVKIGVAPDGKPIYKSVSGKTARELENAKDAARDHFIYGRPIPKEMAFYEYAEQWYTLKKEPFISPASRAAYKSCFMKHLLPEFGLQNMRAIGAAQLQEFVNGFAGTSKSMVTMIVGTLKSIFVSALAEGMIDRDPTAALIRPKPSKKDERRPLTKEETERILETMHTHPDGLFLAVLYYLGVRRGEALGLQWGDFDFAEKQVHIQRDIDFTYSKSQEGELKTAAADRFIPLPNELTEMLLKAKGNAPDKAYLFHQKNGQPLSETSYIRKWRKLMVACGCVEWREIDANTDRPQDIRKQVKPTLTPHFFRHNYVTMLYEAGVDPLIAMKIVGHTDYQTTANIYTHIRDDMLKKATINMEEVFQRREK